MFLKDNIPIIITIKVNPCYDKNNETERELQMGKLSKRQHSIFYMRENQNLFQCPICNETMKVLEDGNIQCDKKHTFIITKQGYVNFLNKQVQSMYSKSLFESRKTIIDSGLYHDVHFQIVDFIGKKPVHTIVDIGCGEGSHLVKICNLLQQDVIGVGMDIAKEGIITAAKYYEQKIWCVGDLAHSPFHENFFDVILNILSPANYGEFKRLLKKGGKVIKVIPQSGYLKELRKQLFADSQKENYSNEQTMKRFYEQFEKVKQQRITYTKQLEPELIPKLLEMTPLGWHAESQDILLKEITIDVDVLVGEV